MRAGRNINGNAGVNIRPTTRVAIYLRDGYRCGWCGADLSECDPFQVTLDHLEPHDNGGGNSPTNLVTACRSCNCRRQSVDWETFAGNSRVISRVLDLSTTPLPRELAGLVIFGVISKLDAIREVRARDGASPQTGSPH